MKNRAPKNKTLSLCEEEISQYAEKLLHIHEKTSPQNIINHTINQNLFEIIDFLPKQFADLIILDPPYNLSKDFHGFKFHESAQSKYIDYLRSWLPKIVALLKPNGSLYACCDWKSSAAIFDVLSECMCIKNRITWQREKGRGAKANWKNSMEDIWYAVKDPNDYYFDVDAVKLKRRVLAPYTINGVPKDWSHTKEGNFRLTYPSNFWDDISIPFWSMPENTDHPTQKPEKLIAKLILASCPEDGVVFDPFLGSGTSSVVAKKLGRNYCGVEFNKEYASWAENRLEKANKDTSIQGYQDGVFLERNTAIAKVANSLEKTE